jgi:hypothetical protein
LSAALRQPVATPAPYLACTNPIHGGPELRPVTLAEPIQQAALAPGLIAVTGVFDRLDAAGNLTSGIQQAVTLNAQHQALSRIRAGQPIEMTGTFVVVRAFHALGTDFPVGALVDRTVMSDGLLFRYWRGRDLQPLETAAVAA